MKQFTYLIILLFLGTASFAQNKPVKPIVSQRPKVKAAKPVVTPVTSGRDSVAAPTKMIVTPLNVLDVNTPSVTTPAVTTPSVNAPVATTAAAVTTPLLKKSKIKHHQKMAFLPEKTWIAV